MRGSSRRGAAETEKAITAAHKSYKSWFETPVSQRESVFLKAADVLGAKAQEITEVLVAEFRIGLRQSGLRGRLLL
ncbi:MAG: aldehyde dehydrogenase family protein [Bradyrhizobium sp.]